MSAHSVRLRFECVVIEDVEKVSPTNPKGTRTVEKWVYVSPKTARKLLDCGKARIRSHHPFEIALKSAAQDELEKFIVQRWTPVSEGKVMSGGILERKPPLR